MSGFPRVPEPSVRQLLDEFRRELAVDIAHAVRAALATRSVAIVPKSDYAAGPEGPPRPAAAPAPGAGARP